MNYKDRTNVFAMIATKLYDKAGLSPKNGDFTKGESPPTSEYTLNLCDAIHDGFF